MSNPKCPQCEATTYKNGFFKSGSQRYRCKCGWFSKSPLPPHRPKNKQPCIDCGNPKIKARQRCESCYRKHLREKNETQRKNRSNTRSF